MTNDVIRFETTMAQTGANTTGVVVPSDVISRLNDGARPAVVATINDYAYRTTVGVMRGQSMLPFSAQHREASGIGGGDPITVELLLDIQPRTVKIPGDLGLALAADPAIEAAFHKLAPSRRKADIETVLGAKTPETRTRRIDAILQRMQVSLGTR
jgi:hypothetical protein